MAKYTESLQEYLEGGGLLPSSMFSLIQGFEDLFKEKYCGSELGFETETLFALKLNYMANVVMPIYAERLAVIVAQMTGIKDNPNKWRYETREYGEHETTTKGDGSTTDLPYNADTATPSATSHNEGGVTSKKHTDTLNFQEGLSIDERLRIIEAINKKAFILVEECLEEFKPLFMGVY